MLRRIPARVRRGLYLGGMTLLLGVGIVLVMVPPQTTTPSQTLRLPDTQQVLPTEAAEQSTPATPAPTGSTGTGGEVAQDPPAGTTRPTSLVPVTPPAPAPTPAEPSLVRAVLAVNGTAKGSVTLPEGSTHCDVLGQALHQGLISSLTMRYNAAYKTYGVYMIDGIGESDVVWWVYTVNGKSPPYGCSHVPVKHNDSVNWEYIRR